MFYMAPDLFIILGISANAVIMWFRSKPYIKENSALQKGYNTIIGGFFIGMSLPIIIMGIGLRFGGVSQIKDYSHPGNGNMFVLAYWMSCWGLIILLNYWIWFQGGAKMLVDHPGILNGTHQNSQTVKWSSLFLLFVSVVIGIAVFSAKPR
jgi:hypothetical protein